MKSPAWEHQLRLINENKDVLRLRPKDMSYKKNNKAIFANHQCNNCEPNIKRKKMERNGNETLRGAIKCKRLVVFIFCTKEETGGK